VSTPQVLLLGALAGLTIFLGLPIARLRRPWPRLQSFLNAGAGGVLLFILFDVLKKSLEKVGIDGHGVAEPGLGLVLLLGLVAGLGGIMAFESRVRRRVGALPLAPHQIALSIAVAIGLHNLSEGLAIGQSAAQGEIQLALLLVVGFALHNATEGFGIAAPLAAGARAASWRFLAVAGLIAGLPTFAGTVIGVGFVSPVLFVLFLALAAGAIVYVLSKLLQVGRRLALPAMALAGLIVGFLAGFGTDVVLTAAGV
jgi:zinc transporter, ZIP family